MTPFSEALRKRVAELGTGREPSEQGHGVSRIIVARELSGYAPFTLGPLADTRGGAAGSRRPEPSFVAMDTRLRPAAPDQASGAWHQAGERDGGHAPGDDAAYEAGRQTGRNEGFALGFEAAVAQAERERCELEAQAGAQLADRIGTLSAALAARFEQIETETADDLVELALAVARQALRSSLALRPEAIVDVVNEAMSGLLDERSRMRLLLNPDDVGLVRGALAEQLQAPGCEIVPDPSVERGGCRIETPRAEIDALVETRWRRTLAAIGRHEDGSLAGHDDTRFDGANASAGQAGDRDPQSSQAAGRGAGQ